jgi:hypothetical protein
VNILYGISGSLISMRLWTSQDIILASWGHGGGGGGDRSVIGRLAHIIGILTLLNSDVFILPILAQLGHRFFLIVIMFLWFSCIWCLYTTVGRFLFYPYLTYRNIHLLATDSSFFLSVGKC